MAFADDVRKFALKADESVDRTVRAVTLSLFNSVIRDTPVDSGRARGAWETTVGQPSSSVPERLDKSGQQAMAEVSANTPKGAGQETYIANNLPYIEELEYGSSKQAPAGMVRVNFARVQKNLADAIAKNKV